MPSHFCLRYTHRRQRRKGGRGKTSQARRTPSWCGTFSAGCARALSKTPWGFVEPGDSHLLAGAALNEVKQFSCRWPRQAAKRRHSWRSADPGRSGAAQATLPNRPRTSSARRHASFAGRDAIEAAERIASERPSEDDDLGRVATSLPSGGSWLAALGDPQHLNSWGPVFRHGLTLTDVMRGGFGLWHKPIFRQVEIRHSMRLGTPVPNSTWPR